MNVLAHLSDIVIPILIFFIVGYGFVSKIKVYEAFLKGAKDGLKIVVDIVPTLIGLLVAVGMLRASGFFDMLGTVFGSVTAAVGLPAQLMPLLVVKLFSSSAATGLVLDIFRTSGPDSYAGMLTSILMSCTDNEVILRGNEEFFISCSSAIKCNGFSTNRNSDLCATSFAVAVFPAPPRPSIAMCIMITSIFKETYL